MLALTGVGRATTPPLAPRVVLERAAQALGGLERLRTIGPVRVEEEGVEFFVTIPSDPRGPRRFAAERVATLWRPAPFGARRTIDQVNAMRQGHLMATTVGTDSVEAVTVGGVVRPGSASDLQMLEEELALAPQRVLLTALSSAGLGLVQDTAIGTRQYHRVVFPMANGRVVLFIDAETSFPSRVRFTRSYPDLVFWAMWGEVTIETIWSSWSLEPSGVWYPRQRTVSFNGEPFREYIVTGLDLAAAAPVDSFAISDSIATTFASARAASTQGAQPVLKPVSLAEGIVLFQGGYQSAIVREAKGVVVIEAPESDAKSRAVLAEAQRMFPGAPILAVVSTSPQWMHVAGLAEYARRRIPIYALDANVREVTTLLAAPRDRPIGRASGADRVIPVGSPVTLGAGANEMRLIPARGEHGNAMLFVYWPARRLLYASDMIIPAAFEPTFTAAYEAELHRTVERLGLDVSTVFALHLPAAPWSGP